MNITIFIRKNICRSVVKYIEKEYQIYRFFIEVKLTSTVVLVSGIQH